MKKYILLVSLVFLGVVIAFPLFSMTYYTMVRTSTPDFCTSCHEIKPAVRAWRSSTHVNNAQGFAPRVPVEEIEDSHWDMSLQTGPKAVWYCCLAVFPYMKGKGGKIINIASGAGIIGIEGEAVYGATKEAIRGFSRTAAREWGKYNININTINMLFFIFIEINPR